MTDDDRERRVWLADYVLPVRGSGPRLKKIQVAEQRLVLIRRVRSGVWRRVKWWQLWYRVAWLVTGAKRERPWS